MKSSKALPGVITLPVKGWPSFLSCACGLGSWVEYMVMGFWLLCDGPGNYVTQGLTVPKTFSSQRVVFEIPSFQRQVSHLQKLGMRIFEEFIEYFQLCSLIFWLLPPPGNEYWRVLGGPGNWWPLPLGGCSSCNEHLCFGVMVRGKCLVTSLNKCTWKKRTCSHSKWSTLNSIPSVHIYSR